MKFTSLIAEKVNNLDRPKKIVLIDGDNKIALSAAKELAKFKNIELILLEDKQQTCESCCNENPKIKFLNLLNETKKTEELAQQYFEMREAKEKARGRENKDTLDICKKMMKSRPYFAMMLLQTGEVDGVVGGLDYSTADILRAGFKVIGPKKGTKTISSVMIMHKDENTLFFSDISVNIKPTEESLVDIAKNAGEFVEQFGIEPRIAFLSFSTNFSAKSPESELVHNAASKFRELHSQYKSIGEVQLDAALDLDVRNKKYSLEKYDEISNTLIFPELNAGNIGYKLVQRLANYGAIGPIIVGTNKPVNDLSRGSKVEDVVNTVLITALQAK
ncbi:phosphotransacetylase [Mycoplasmopsis lipofaciens]|uniref:phosphotransacetylase n=1 Tax=Mycoplasmopsis lipofaciens TaxID=114884 RepID=UPI0004895895|nr:phosphotransacetylase [Mycoplasmopsis lipofaciens]